MKCVLSKYSKTTETPLVISKSLLILLADLFVASMEDAYYYDFSAYSQTNTELRL